MICLGSETWRGHPQYDNECLTDVGGVVEDCTYEHRSLETNLNAVPFMMEYLASCVEATTMHAYLWPTSFSEKPCTIDCNNKVQ